MNNFDRVMQGFNFGASAVRQYQDAKLERDAGDAYKNTGQQTGTTSDFGKVEQEGLYQGPNSDGQMTNAEAASYGLMQPQSTKTDYTLAGKTQGTAFTEGQIEAARTRASADVYANAGRMREASGLRRDAAQLGLTELQMQGAQRESDQGIAMDKKFAGMPKINGWMDTATGEHNVDPVSRQAALEAKGMSPAEAQAASTSGLRKVTQADQQSYSASVYLEGGHKYLREYNDAIKSAATERSNQVRRDVNRASTMDDVSKAYGHIDDGKSIRSVPQMDDKGKPTGKFQIEKFDTGTGRAVGLLQAGKVFDSMDQLKADINVSMNENPDVFVAHEQAQAQRAMEERKLAEESRKNKANEGLHAESNKTAKQQAGTAELAQQSTAKANAASAGLHTAQTDVVKGGLALDKAYQTDESLRTPEQTAMLKGAAQKATDQAIAKARHPDAVLAARAVATKDVNTYLNNSKTALTNYGTSEVQQRAAFTHISQQLLHGINDADSIGRFDVVTEAHKILDRAVELQKSGNKGTIDQIAVGLIKQPTVPAAAAGAAPAAVGATTPAPDDATKYRHLYQNKQ